MLLFIIKTHKLVRLTYWKSSILCLTMIPRLAFEHFFKFRFSKTEFDQIDHWIISVINLIFKWIYSDESYDIPYIVIEDRTSRPNNL